MKKFLLIIFLISFNLEASEIYYCSNEDKTGFVVKENHRVANNWEDLKFKIKIDLEKKTMLSEKIWMKGEVKCTYSTFSETLYCISNYGAALSFYAREKKFALSQLFVSTEYNDDLVISYGYCEKF